MPKGGGAVEAVMGMPVEPVEGTLPLCFGDEEG